MCSFVAFQKHFATRRRIGSPHASGLTAVSDFSSAIDTPPAMNFFRNAGARPAAKSLTAHVSAFVKLNDWAHTLLKEKWLIAK